MSHEATDSELERAIQAILNTGIDVDDISTDIGISRSTLRKWIQGGSHLPQNPGTRQAFLKELRRVQEEYRKISRGIRD